MVEGAIPMLTNFHFSGGTLLYAAIIAPFRISVPKKNKKIYITWTFLRLPCNLKYANHYITDAVPK